MTSPSGREQLQAVHKDLINIKGAIGALQPRVETLLAVLNDSDLSTGIKQKFGMLEGTLDRLAQAIINNSLCVRLLERHLNLNSLASINRLPVEIFTDIILLAKKPISTNWKRHPYLSYTWICHHWRTVLIHSPIFWTLIQPSPPRSSAISPISEKFYHELFRRAKSSKLDIIIASYRSDSLSAKPQLEKLFAERSSHIRRLWLYNNNEGLTQLVLSGRHLSSLHGFIIHSSSPSLPRLLPILTTSDHLETFECSLHPSQNWTETGKDQLASIFSRIRNLSLTLYSSELIQLVLVLLHKNARLQSLRFTLETGIYLSDQDEFIFPELQFLSVNRSYLMDDIRTPKLSSLNVTPMSAPVTLASPIMKEFDFLSIKCLWIRDEYDSEDKNKNLNDYCILGTKERTDCNDLFSDILFGDHSLCESPCNCFRFKFKRDFGPVLKEALSSVIPQLTNLVELHLLFPRMCSAYREIIPRVPSIQRLFVEPGNRLISLLRFLSNPSRCPQLTYLSCTIFPPRKDFADDVGRSLTNCLVSDKMPPLVTH